MCATCGCSDDAKPQVVNMQTGKSVSIQVVSIAVTPEHSQMHEHDNEHTHSHPHTHDDLEHDDGHGHVHSHDHRNQHHDHWHDHARAHDHEYLAPSDRVVKTVMTLEEKVLAKNSLLAERNRGWFDASNILAINLVSSPGAGKTALLERTIRELRANFNMSVIEGDQATQNDAERIKSTGCKVVQINTGAGCHLDAEMLSAGLKQLGPPSDSVLFIENVGNLVCPALFDLGEDCKVAILSITEGEDKPVKYPHIFRAANLLLLNKIDLLPHLDFDIEACKSYARAVNPKMRVIEVSAIRGTGMDAWYSWIRRRFDGHVD